MYWIPITLVAVVLQIVRNSSSRRLSAEFSAEAVSLARFLPGIPLVATVFFASLGGSSALRITSPLFLLWAAFMGASQIGANMLLVFLMKRRNFASSITLVKTETVFVALMGALFLGETPGPFQILGILLASLGLVVASVAKDFGSGNLKRALFSFESLLALGAGLGLALATIFVKLAYSCVTAATPVTWVSFTLLIILCMQSAGLLIAVWLKDRNELGRAVRRPVRFITTGMLGASASLMWFLAFSMTALANVRTLGQTEFILGVAASAFLFKEKIWRLEVVGMALVAAGTVALLLQ